MRNWLVIFIAFCCSGAAVSAAQLAPNSTIINGITVSPAFVSVQVGSKQPQATASISVRNNADVAVTVTATLSGLSVRNNSLIPSVASQAGFANLIRLSPESVVIPPGSSKNIGISVVDSAKLAPGGHYLSVLIAQTALNNDTVTPQLSLEPAISTTVYVVKEDGAVRSLKGDHPKFSRLAFSFPDTASVSFNNVGNVVATPRGLITIAADDSNRVVAQAIVNPNSVPIFPKSASKLNVQFTNLKTIRLPGFYTATLTYRYDGEDASHTSKSSFVYIPPIILLLLIIVIISMLWILQSKNRSMIVRWLRNRQRRAKRKPFIAPKVPVRPSKNRRIIDVLPVEDE